MAVRMHLAQQGSRKGGLRILDRTVARVKARNAKAPRRDIEAAIDEALAVIRTDGFRSVLPSADLLRSNILISVPLAPSGPPDQIYQAWRDGRFVLYTSEERRYVGARLVFQAEGEEAARACWGATGFDDAGSAVPAAGGWW